MFVLRMLCYQVLYDCHENLPAQVLEKRYLKGIIRVIVIALINRIYPIMIRKLKICTAANKEIENQFKSYGLRSVFTLQNYPIN